MSALLAVIYNAHRGPKQRAKKPEDINPFKDRGAKSGIPLTRQNVSVLKSVFVKRPGRRFNRQDAKDARKEAD